jgi:hypothetical protein
MFLSAAGFGADRYNVTGIVWIVISYKFLILGSYFPG